MFSLNSFCFCNSARKAVLCFSFNESTTTTSLSVLSASLSFSGKMYFCKMDSMLALHNAIVNPLVPSYQVAHLLNRQITQIKATENKIRNPTSLLNGHFVVSLDALITVVVNGSNCSHCFNSHSVLPRYH